MSHGFPQLVSTISLLTDFNRSCYSMSFILLFFFFLFLLLLQSEKAIGQAIVWEKPKEHAIVGPRTHPKNLREETAQNSEIRFKTIIIIIENCEAISINPHLIIVHHRKQQQQQPNKRTNRQTKKKKKSEVWMREKKTNFIKNTNILKVSRFPRYSNSTPK